MKNYEYKEPEFKAVISKNNDVITTSGKPPEGKLGIVTYDWESSEVPIEV